MWLLIVLPILSLREVASHDGHALSRIAIHQAVFALDNLAYINVFPSVLGTSVCTQPLSPSLRCGF
ncbi:hypothetical protein AKJ16_DCAP11261 [Drosera capensis]